MEIGFKFHQLNTATENIRTYNMYIYFVHIRLYHTQSTGTYCLNNVCVMLFSCSLSCISNLPITQKQQKQKILQEPKRLNLGFFDLLGLPVRFQDNKFEYHASMPLLLFAGF